MLKKKSLMFIFLFMMVLIFQVKVYAAENNQYVVSTNGANLNVRSGPSTSYRVVSRLKNKTAVEVTKQSGSWYQIEYQSGKYGYVSKHYLKVPGSSDHSSYPVTANVSQGTVPLKIRKSPSTASMILGRIPRGSKITVTGQYNSAWYIVEYEGITGYSSSDYISLITEDNTPSESIKYQKIQLSVPCYFQYDSRWKNIRLGSEGSIMKTSGCAVCGLAVMESYLTGVEVLPSEMIKKLSFTKEGYVYWPSKYTSYSGASYLTKIYEQLENGKPVLFGAKKINGKQHWVVVYGYQGNGKQLDPEDFLIVDSLGKYNDLASYMRVYPKFYKYLYVK